nr:uncharacterized protein LOC117220752 [Megalopta genalis]
MFAIQNIVRRAPQISKVVVNQRRNIVAVPPRCKVSIGEFMVHSAFMWLSMMGIPLYIACNVTKYSAAKGLD